MKKLWNSVYAFWLLKVRNRVRKTIDKGGFVTVFRDYDMTIKTKSDNFRMRLRADCHPFGYLSVSAAKDKVDNIHGFAVLLYILATCITKDEKLYNEVVRAVNRYNKREEALAAAGLKEEKDADVADKAALEEVKAETDAPKLSRAQRREKEREMRKIVRKEMLNKKEDDE